MPDGTFFHGLSYGDVNAPFPVFPCGASSWNAGAGGTGSTFYFNCGDWDDTSNTTRTTATNRTPGVSNNASNLIFVTNVKNGTVDYNVLSDPAHCASVIPASVSNLSLSKSVSNTNPAPGEAFNFVLDAACNSTSGDCENVVIRDTLPGTVEFVNFSFPLPDGVSSATYDLATREIVILFDASTCSSCTPDGIGDEDDLLKGQPYNYQCKFFFQ